MVLLEVAYLVAVTSVFVMVLRMPSLQQDPQLVISGYTAAGFEPVRDAFRENYVSGRDSLSGGSGFSAYYQGVKVVDIWGGYADAQSKQVWKEDTLTMLHSTTKGIAALCIAVLVDRGLLDYDKPVANYWPEFAQNGKGNITVRQMMEHKAGLVLAAPPGLSLNVLKDVAKEGELMAASEPVWDVNAGIHGYQAITIGPLTNELLRRVDPKHRTMGRFLAEEIAEPFGINSFLGLPLPENHRVARAILNFTPFSRRLLSDFLNTEHRHENWHLLTDELTSKVFENAGDINEFYRFNDPANRALELASVNGFGTASAIAKLFGIIGAGGTDPATNRTLLSRQLIDAFILEAEPPSFDRILGIPTSFSRGMMVDELVNGVKMFGHVGAGGQVGYADPNHEVGVAFLSSYQMPVLAAKDERSLSLIRTLYTCIAKLEGH